MTRDRGPRRPADLAAVTASLTRYQRRLLDVLIADGAGMTVQELAEVLELHPNTVRGHLDALREQELVAAETRLTTAPGRPAQAYRALVGAPEARADHLIALLALALREGDGSETDRALAVGRAWGEHMLARDPVRDAGAVDAVANHMGAMGFAPVVERDRIALHRCPLLPDDGDIPPGLCDIHQGMVEAVVTAAGGDPTAVTVCPFDAPASCSIRFAGADDLRCG